MTEEQDKTTQLKEEQDDSKDNLIENPDFEENNKYSQESPIKTDSDSNSRNHFENQSENSISENSRLKEEISILKQEVLDLQEIREQLPIKEEQIHSLENEIQEKIREFEAQKSEILRLDELESNNEHLRNENIQLNDRVTQNATEYSILQNENKIYLKQIEEREYELNKKTEKIEESIPKLEHLKEIEEEYEKMSNAIVEYNKNEEKLKEKIAELTQTSYEYQASQKEISEFTREINDLKTKITLKNTRLQELVQDLEVARNSYFKLREEMSNTDQSENEIITELNARIIENDIQIDEFKQEIRGYEDKFQQMIYREELEKIQMELDAQKNLLISKEQKIEDQTQEIEIIQQTFDEEKSDLISKSEELLKEIKEKEHLDEEIRNRDESIRELQIQEDEFHEALMENVKLTGEIEDWEKKFVENRSQKEVLYDRIHELNRDNSGNVAIISRLEGKIKDLESTLKGKDLQDSEEIKSFQLTIEELNLKIHELNIESSEIKGKYSATKELFDQLSPKLIELQEKYDNVKMHLSQIEKEAKDERLAQSELLSERESEILQIKEAYEKVKVELVEAKKGGEFKDKFDNIKNKLEESNLMNDSLADDLSKAKIDILLEKKESRRMSEEIINLKRRIKILRRDLISKR